MLVSGRNAGFVVASQVGLLLAAGFAAVSSLSLSPARSAAVMRHQRLLRGGLVLLMLVWAAVSLAQLPPLDRPLSEEAAADWLRGLAVVGVALYALAAGRYLALYRRRPAVMLLSVITAFALLAEAMVAVALARSWRISWWEWHLLMAFGFGFVAYSAYVQYRREGGSTALFRGIYLEETIQQLRGEYQAALEAFVAALRQRAAAAPGASTAPIAGTLRSRFELTEGQTEVLEQAAEAVGRERDQNERLGALVAVGNQARVILDDQELLRRAIAVENARLYRELHGLFRQYMSPDVATALLADPSQAALGDGAAEVTVLCADLRGVTPFSERAAPARVVALLNRYHGAAVPQVLLEGGTVVQFAGDAIMALFNAPVAQPDHALRAARAALAMQDAVEAVAEGDPELPRFRVGINTGPALVGNIGSAEIRNFTAIGDTVNLAARLETSAPVGRVVIGAATYQLIKDVAVVTPLGELELKGKQQPVAAYQLHRLEG